MLQVGRVPADSRRRSHRPACRAVIAGRDLGFLLASPPKTVPITGGDRPGNTELQQQPVSGRNTLYRSSSTAASFDDGVACAARSVCRPLGPAVTHRERGVEIDAPRVCVGICDRVAIRFAAWPTRKTGVFDAAARPQIAAPFFKNNAGVASACKTSINWRTQARPPRISLGFSRNRSGPPPRRVPGPPHGGGSSKLAPPSRVHRSARHTWIVKGAHVMPFRGSSSDGFGIGTRMI
jgi:hypothetical protein